jgi:hypothetical protein
MLVSHYRHLELQEGMPFGRELAIRGAEERLAPILMTALAIALALVPIVVGGTRAGYEIEHPLAVVLLGGLTTSTLLNLFRRTGALSEVWASRSTYVGPSFSSGVLETSPEVDATCARSSGRRDRARLRFGTRPQPAHGRRQDTQVLPGRLGKLVLALCRDVQCERHIGSRVNRGICNELPDRGRERLTHFRSKSFHSAQKEPTRPTNCSNAAPV